MAEIVKSPARKEDYLTVEKFRIKYGKTKKLTSAAFNVLYKKNKLARDEHGRLQQVVFRNKLAHSSRSLLQAHPAFHDIILAEIDKQAVIQEKLSQGTTK